MIDQDLVARAEWRKSSFSGSNGDPGTVLFTRTEMHAWIKGCKAGEFDDVS